MCVLAFAWAAHPDWPLVLIGNRDERHARPAAALAHWEDYPHVIAGRDLEAGGTWLGVSTEGRFAVVTNMHNPDGPAPGKASRGALVADILSGEGRYSEIAEPDAADFNPFNLIAVDSGGAAFFSNRPDPQLRPLDPGLYGLSNGTLDEPWPKTLRIKALLQDWLEADSGDLTVLLDGMRANDAPQVEPRRARESPIFIRTALYGTRCSTVVAIGRDGQGRIVERRYDANGDASGETVLEFEWKFVPPAIVES